jgi:hypothetical protein
MDEYLFIALAKLRFDARRLEAQTASEAAGKEVRPRHQLDEAAAEDGRPVSHHSPKARWFVPGSECGEQS